MIESKPKTPETGAEADIAPVPDQNARARRRALLIVFFVVFIDLLGFGIVLPLLPLYAKNFIEPILGTGHEVALGLILGLLMSCFSLMQFVFAPIWGRISDRVGRRPILILGLVGSVVFYSLFGVASALGPVAGLVLLFVSRLGAGVAGATISTAQAVIADSTKPEKRSHGMALIGMAFGIGFTFGPLLGYASKGIAHPGAPGFLAAGLSLLATILAMVMLPETLRTESEGPRRGWLDLQSLRNALATPTVGGLIVTFFLATFAFGGLESTLALLNKDLLLRSTDGTASAADDLDRTNFLVFAFVGFILVLAQGFYRPFATRVGEIRFMRIGMAVMSVGLALAGAVAWMAHRGSVDHGSSILWYSLPVLAITVVGYAFLTPSLQALISKRSDPARQGEILGVNQSAAAMSRILGPVVWLAMYHMQAAHVLPYVFGAILLGVVFLATLRIR